MGNRCCWQIYLSAGGHATITDVIREIWPLHPQHDHLTSALGHDLMRSAISGLPGISLSSLTILNTIRCPYNWAGSTPQLDWLETSEGWSHQGQPNSWTGWRKQHCSGEGSSRTTVLPAQHTNRCDSGSTVASSVISCQQYFQFNNSNNNNKNWSLSNERQCFSTSDDL